MRDAHAEFYRGVEAASRALAARGRGAAADRAGRRGEHGDGEDGDDGDGARVPRALAGAAADAAAVHAATADLLTAEEPPRACRHGCASCCHFPVGVTFGEALLLAHAVAADPALREATLAANAATEALAWPQLVGMPCPLLGGGACMAYAQRPLPCRALASGDAAACASALRGEAASPPWHPAPFWRGLGAAAVIAPQHPAGTRELRSAVAAVLEAQRDGTDCAAAFGLARPAG